MIDAMKQALDALDLVYEQADFSNGVIDPTGTMDEGKVVIGGIVGAAISAIRQAIEQAEKPPIYVERATTNYEDGWEEGFKAGAQKEKESTPSNVDPRVPLTSNVNHNKINENRLCDIERRLAKIETQPIKESTLQEISDIGQWETSDMAHRSGGLSVEQAEKQEPVANRSNCGHKEFMPLCQMCQAMGTQAHSYAAPPRKEWVGLTDDDLENQFGFIDEWLRYYAYRIEAKLREKNNG